MVGESRSPQEKPVIIIQYTWVEYGRPKVSAYDRRWILASVWAWACDHLCTHSVSFVEDSVTSSLDIARWLETFHFARSFMSLSPTHSSSYNIGPQTRIPQDRLTVWSLPIE
jgi:hypothetical protein